MKLDGGASIEARPVPGVGPFLVVASFLQLLLFPSCSPSRTGELVPLPVVYGTNALDSSQAQATYTAARHFPNGTQLSICIITGDVEKYAGVLRRNDSLVYIENRDSVFEIGSITKTFTGTMLAKLVYDGRARPDDPVQKFLPIRLKQSALNGREMTLVHLANHTSGLPFEPPDVRSSQGESFSEYHPYRFYDIAKLYNYLSHDQVLASVPGEKRVYSNLGGALLGHLLTLATGKSYEELLLSSVCIPLGMRRTFVTMSDQRQRMMVQGRDADGKLLPFVGDDLGAFVGAGAIKSCASDLARYLRANMTDTSYFLLAQRPTKQFDEHFAGSLAWAPYREGNLEHIGAFGATGGYTGGVIFERNKQVGVVVLTNASAFLMTREDFTDKLCRALYDPLPRENQTSDAIRQK